jgi:hypothetical protein
MKFSYISPSTLPSRAASAVHVALQCEGLARLGTELTLYAKRAMADAGDFLPAMKHAYGVDLPGVAAVSFYSTASRGDNLRIAALALASLRRGRRPDAILSRNLYASFVLAALQQRPLLFETHQLEYGFRKMMQRRIMTRPWVTTVVISDRLLDCLEQHHGVRPANPLVLRDAAPDGIEAIAPALRRRELLAVVPEASGDWGVVCGYFGHLYAGRGIDVIEAMAAARPRVLFLVFGGNDDDVRACRARNRVPNLRFLGHVPHPLAQRAMRAVDVLLMPYQESVSIGVARHDTARWMSPMKMFEYMASGVPIVSSDLPALREVLRHGETALLAPPADAAAWTAALDRLGVDSAFANSLGARAHEEYRVSYTWSQRGRRLLEAARRR